jgi:cyclic pyranopterin phosphate synthase
MMPTYEVLDTVRAGLELGIKIVHLTGGEPSKREDIVPLVAGMRDMGIGKIEMTTNGVPYYKLVDSLVGAGLTGVNISLDTLNSKLFEQITGVNAIDLVLRAIKRSQELLKPHVTINMVVMENNFGEMKDFLDFSRQTGVMVRFCELTPHGPYMQVDPYFFSNNHVPKSRILHTLQGLAPSKDVARTSIDRQNAHSEYLIMGGDYNDMTVGIIAPYSNGWPCPGPDCVRLRIGPTSANSCVIYPERNLLGTTFEEKKAILQELVLERLRQMQNDEFPDRHEPAYSLYRFGLPER